MTEAPKVPYAKAEKARRLMKAMELLLEGRRPKEVKDLVGVTYQDMIKVKMITKLGYFDKQGNRIGTSPFYVSALEQ